MTPFSDVVCAISAVACSVAWVVPLDNSEWAQSSTAYAISTPTPSTQAPAPVAVSVSERMSEIMRFFSLSVTEAAKIFDVSRPTIYAWLKLEDDKQLEAQNRERIYATYGLCREGVSLGGSLYTRFTDDQQCIMDYLKQPELASSKIQDRLSMLLAKQQDPFIKNPLCPPSVSDQLRALGYGSQSVEEQEETLKDNLHRLRIGSFYDV